MTDPKKPRTRRSDSGEDRPARPETVQDLEVSESRDRIKGGWTRVQDLLVRLHLQRGLVLTSCPLGLWRKTRSPARARP